MSVQSNPDVQDWMEANSLGSLAQLEGYFESRVLDLATLAGRSYIVWQVQTLFWQPQLNHTSWDILSLLTCQHDAAHVTLHLVMMLVVMCQVVAQPV